MVVAVIWFCALPFRRAVTVMPGSAAPAAFVPCPRAWRPREDGVRRGGLTGHDLDHVDRVGRGRVGVVVQRQVAAGGVGELQGVGRPAAASSPVRV